MSSEIKTLTSEEIMAKNVEIQSNLEFNKFKRDARQNALRTAFSMHNRHGGSSINDILRDAGEIYNWLIFPELE
jgi:hypothetical protein